MDNKHIHVILEGVRYDSYSIRGIYLDEATALAAAEAHVAARNADDCAYERMGDDVLIWTDGGSYVEVAKYPLNKLF
jgi:hypothetical protein